MCGILFTSKLIKNLAHVIQYLKNRGPDVTTHKVINGFTFVHTLLSMTGNITPEPFIDENNKVIALFNGEIYNYKSFGDYKSDGECIIPAYLKYGETFIRQFDGEFAVILYDYKYNKIIISTDTFSTKPLWLGIDLDTNDKHIGVSSYKSCLDRLQFKNVVQVEANTLYVINSLNYKIISKYTITTFDLRQYKTDMTDFFKAFTESIKKRTNNIKHGIFIGLSSGYDSGAIACELNRQGVNFTAYSIIGSEDKNTIENRRKLLKDVQLLDMTREQFMAARDKLKNQCEEYKLNIDNGEIEALEKELKGANNSQTITHLKNVIEFRKNKQILTDDNGSIGVAHICSIARPKNQLIYISGSGADEIFSDYGFNGIKHYGHSTIGGKFPDNLATVFPWKNFFGNTQRAYLMKEEYVTGAFGIEGRYPFLDKQVVQEFLWLSTSVKNSRYKAPLYNYLTTYKFPLLENAKVGFSCGFSGTNPSAGHEYTKQKQSSALRQVGKAVHASNVVDMAHIQKTNEHTVYLLNSNFKKTSPNGHSYFYNIDVNSLGDIWDNNSPFILYENNKPLPFRRSRHDDINKLGMGRYSHWTSKLIYFSSSDNSNPITNGRIYKLAIN